MLTVTTHTQRHTKPHSYHQDNVTFKTRFITSGKRIVCTAVWSYNKINYLLRHKHNTVRGFKPGRSRRIFKGEKILSTPSFGGEVKPSVPCRRFAAYKRSLELCGSRILDEICRNISRPRRVPPSAARGLSRRWTWRHLAEKVGTSKGGGKQWQPTPKNLPRTQCARAIPVAWLGSGSC